MKIKATIFKMGTQCKKSEIELRKTTGKKKEGQIRPINITLKYKTLEIQKLHKRRLPA